MDDDMLKRFAQMSSGTYGTRNLEDDNLEEHIGKGMKRVYFARKNRARVKDIMDKEGEFTATQYQVICIAYVLGFKDDPDIEGPTGISLTKFKREIKPYLSDDGLFRKDGNSKGAEIYLSSCVEATMKQLGEKEKLIYSHERYVDAYKRVTLLDLEK